jgi:hypothetical protein
MGVFLFYLTAHSILSALCYYFIYFQNSFTGYNTCLKINLIIEFVCLFAFIYKEIRNRFRFYLLSSLFIAFFSIFTYEQVSYNLNEFKNGSTLFEFFALIIITIYFFYEKLFQFELEESIINKKFIIIIGLFLYFTGNFFYMLLVEISKSSTTEIKTNLTVIYCSITILKNIIISIGLSLPEKPENPDNFIPFAGELETNTIQNTHNPS